MPVEERQKTLKIIELLTCSQANDHIRFFKEPPIITEITLTLMMWKVKSDTTHCKCLCPARVIASLLNCWPVMRIFPGRDPRNSSWTLIIWEESEEFLFIPDTRLPSIVHTKEITCSCRIRIIHTTFIVCDDHWLN